ncbi:MAG TPA: hypothetical protein VHL34_13070 [Rhizomicrobium sp.]|nr:hypothetical protein [Rhizomicrobium sp.]
MRKNRIRHLLAAIVIATTIPAAAYAADAAGQTATISLDQLKGMMVGTWQNLDETGFTRQLNADGTCIDRFEGDASATSSGVWMLYDGRALPPFLAARKLPAEGVYMTLSEHGDLYTFALTAFSPQSLQMINIDRKMRLSFGRLK